MATWISHRPPRVCHYVQCRGSYHDGVRGACDPVVTTACRTREICIYLVAHLVATPIPAIVVVADCAPAVVLTQPTLGSADSSGRI
jgi:hypothetical protein